ncbi:MAG: transposase [Pyrinomonadaceae bacterium]
MEARDIKGLEIASNYEITHEGNIYIVPSQTSSKKYNVNLFIQTCTCPDYEANRRKCKHLIAVEYALQRENAEKLPVPPKIAKPTYKQEWPAYNAAQVNEKAKFQLLLHALCAGIEEPIQKMGRPRQLLADVLFAASFKVYSTVSGRRFSGDLKDAHDKGYLSKLPSYNCVFDYFKMETLTPYLHQLIRQSSLALREVETNFAVDSSGLSTSQYTRWMHAKYGKAKIVDKQDWIKLHLICGVKTNIVTAVELSGCSAGDSPRFKPLVLATAKNFVIDSVCADKGYSAESSLKLVLENRAMPYIMFRSNATDKDKRSGSVWKRMLNFYQYNQEWFLEHYHRRSNVESTFSMIKRKFGSSLKSKTRTAQYNEALCKGFCPKSRLKSLHFGQSHPYVYFVTIVYFVTT